MLSKIFKKTSYSFFFLDVKVNLSHIEGVVKLLLQDIDVRGLKTPSLIEVSLYPARMLDLHE